MYKINATVHTNNFPYFHVGRDSKIQKAAVRLKVNKIFITFPRESNRCWRSNLLCFPPSLATTSCTGKDSTFNNHYKHNYPHKTLFTIHLDEDGYIDVISV